MKQPELFVCTQCLQEKMALEHIDHTMMAVLDLVGCQAARDPRTTTQQVPSTTVVTSKEVEYEAPHTHTRVLRRNLRAYSEKASVKLIALLEQMVNGKKTVHGNTCCSSQFNVFGPLTREGIGGAWHWRLTSKN